MSDKGKMKPPGVGSLLVADMGRQFFYEGQPDRKATRLDVVLRCLSPRFLPVVLLRMAHATYVRRVPVVPRVLSMVNFVLFGLEVALRCEIGPGLYLPHTQGTVIGARRIGANAVVYHGTTFGAKEIDIAYSDDQRPEVGDNVIVGSGAKILGPVVIGDGAVVGANAVVVSSVPAGAVVGGVPAQVIRMKHGTEHH